MTCPAGKGLIIWGALWTAPSSERTTRERKIDANTFLIWQGGDVADFEFTAKVRFKENNSGVQCRSQFIDEPNFALMGYQMDLHPSAKFFGMLYGEKYERRGKIMTRGRKVEIDANAAVKQTDNVGSNEELTDWKWNDIRIIAVGDRLIHQVGGVTTIDVTDQRLRPALIMASCSENRMVDNNSGQSDKMHCLSQSIRKMP